MTGPIKVTTFLYMQMSSLIAAKLRKLAIVVASVIVVLICSYFLLIFCGAYLLLGSLQKDAAIEQKSAREPVLAVSNSLATPPQGPPKFTVRQQTRKPRPKLSPEQEQVREAKFRRRILFVKEIVALRKDPRLELAPPICEIICAQSTWRKRTEGEEIWDHFNSFLEAEGSRAFDDPKFRLTYELVNSFGDVLMVVGNSMEILEPLVRRKSELSTAEKIYWAANAPLIIARMASQLEGLIPAGRKQAKTVVKLMELNKLCKTHPSEEIESSCRSLIEDNLMIGAACIKENCRLGLSLAHPSS